MLRAPKNFRSVIHLRTANCPHKCGTNVWPKNHVLLETFARTLHPPIERASPRKNILFKTCKNIEKISTFSIPLAQ
jgi:hypothetical protein